METITKARIFETLLEDWAKDSVSKLEMLFAAIEQSYVCDGKWAVNFKNLETRDPIIRRQ